MSEIKWIKITIDIFDDEKIKLIETLPDSDSIIVIWFKLLTLAGKKNDNGLIYITRDLPYDVESLAIMFNRPKDIVTKAINKFIEYEWIVIENNNYKIINQNIRDRNTKAYREWRENVFLRDRFTCQKCWVKGYIVAHHIKSWSKHPKLRHDITNGITYCKECHKKVHKFGFKNEGVLNG